MVSWGMVGPSSLRRSVRAAEGARLESVCALTPYRGFESHLLRFRTLSLFKLLI